MTNLLYVMCNPDLQRPNVAKPSVHHRCATHPYTLWTTDVEHLLVPFGQLLPLSLGGPTGYRSVQLGTTVNNN